MLGQRMRYVCVCAYLGCRTWTSSWLDWQHARIHSLFLLNGKGLKQKTLECLFLHLLVQVPFYLSRSETHSVVSELGLHVT